MLIIVQWVFIKLICKCTSGKIITYHFMKTISSTCKNIKRKKKNIQNIAKGSCLGDKVYTLGYSFMMML